MILAVEHEPVRVLVKSSKIAVPGLNPVIWLNLLFTIKNN